MVESLTFAPTDYLRETLTSLIEGAETFYTTDNIVQAIQGVKHRCKSGLFPY